MEINLSILAVARLLWQKATNVNKVQPYVINNA